MAKYRKKIQVGILVIFGVLIFTGKVQLWMVIFLGSLLLSTLFGRFYCGYMCPINTVMEVIDKDASKKKRKRKKTPDWMKSNLVRGGILILFIGTMVLVLKTGKKLPVLPVLFSLGVVITIFFEPSLWHRYLCPYGTLFSIFSKTNRKGYEVADEGCIQCGMCVRSCPADAINWPDRKIDPVIIKSDCLVCGKCVEACPENIIGYGNSRIEPNN